MTGWAHPAVEVRETHSGVVALVGERAYKAKKPVRTGFLDFRTPASRESALRTELELNRRLAPDAYLGISHVSDPEGGPAEPLLVMRRMPAERRLATLVSAGAPVGDELDGLAVLLADFHRTARRGPEVDRHGGRDALRSRWAANLAETRATAGGVLDPIVPDRIEQEVERYLDGRGALLADRVAAGRVVDGHGDLTAEDVFCLPDGPRVLDCLDFDVALRCVDGLDDAAFLAMDLEHLGHPELAAHWLTAYRVAAADTDAPRSLAHHYTAYRAFVRAKVDCLQHAQGHDGAAEQARRHAALALTHLDRGAVRLSLVGGLPGTGKSTVATALAAATGAVVLSSDQVRRELRDAGVVRGRSGVAGAGAYTTSATDLVHDELRARARAHLRRGVSVVLDASFGADRHRAAAGALAADTGSRLVALRCTVSRAVAARRIVVRPPGFSEATPELADAVAAVAEPWPDARVVDTAGTVEASVGAALVAWGAHPGPSALPPEDPDGAHWGTVPRPGP